MSVNHQFFEYSDTIAARYVKTVPYSISGWRLDPSNKNNRLSFLLSTPERDLVLKNQPRLVDGVLSTYALEQNDFSYDEEVLELYSQEESKMFERLNRAAIEKGLLKPFTDKLPEVDTTNFLSDEEIIEIASVMSLSSFKKRISAIDSKPTLSRILEAANNLNRSANIIRAVEDKIDELNR
jgi:hypothetical protein